jgi:hypothetical protein
VNTSISTSINSVLMAACVAKGHVSSIVVVAVAALGSWQQKQQL